MPQTSNKSLVSFTHEQVDLIRKQIAPKATPDELALFLYVARRSGLDPLTRQIYCIHRNVKERVGNRDVWAAKMTIQTSIDGFRVVARRTGLYAGQSKPVFSYTKDGLLESAEITVYQFRGDERFEAATAIAFWDEYKQVDQEGNPTGMWRKMPRNQLAKVAEALALRKAFPQDLSGLYTEEEMQQADNHVDPIEADPRSIDELMENYLLAFSRYEELVGANNAAHAHPDNWKSKPNKKGLLLAIDAIETRIHDEETKQTAP